MKKLVLGLSLIGVCLGAVGCGSAYTSIRPLEDGTYLLTENAQGFFAISGVVYRCTPQGDKLICKEISGP
jgi:hypothetical protein